MSLDYGFKVSKSGFDVNTAADKDMILTTKYPFFKAYTQGSFSLSITGPGIFTNTITHNLGYHIAYLHLGVFLPTSPTRRDLGSFAAQALGVIQSDSYTTINTVVMGWNDTSASPGFFATYPYTIYIYYYLFYDSLT